MSRVISPVIGKPYGLAAVCRERGGWLARAFTATSHHRRRGSGADRTSLREKLIKIGADVATHWRYETFQLANVAVPCSRKAAADPGCGAPATPAWSGIKAASSGDKGTDAP